MGAGDIGVYYLREPRGVVGAGSAVECWVDDNVKGAVIIENSAGIGEAMRVVVRERRRDPSRKSVLIVLTDGRATDGGATAAVAAEVLRSGINSVVVDTEAANVRLGLARGLAETLGARYVRFDGLLPGSLAGLAKRTTERGAA